MSHKFKTDERFRKAVICNTLLIYDMLNGKHKKKVKVHIDKINFGNGTYKDCCIIGRLFDSCMKAINIKKNGK